jgi:hypothetical protein
MAKLRSLEHVWGHPKHVRKDAPHEHGQAMKRHKPRNLHRMLFAHNGLKAFLGQEPREWFLTNGFNYTSDQIGFNLQHNRTLKKERFDFPFNSEAIKMVMDQLTSLNEPPHPEADEDTPV